MGKFNELIIYLYKFIILYLSNGFFSFLGGQLHLNLF
jgi:hypothetical protein